MHLKIHRGPDSDIYSINLKPSATIYIMGVCGTAMSSLAGLLKKMGYNVRGSDNHFYPPVSEELKKMGIFTIHGYKAENIHSGLDLVIVGNVISRNMPEAQALLKSGLPYISLPSALNSFIIGTKTGVMICGTHGKTTVSCLSAWVLQECGLNPGFMIGGVAENFDRSFHLNDSHWFVLEGDEYDTAFFEKTPKCIHYNATYTLLNNIEFDHADIYQDIKEVERAFRLLMEKKVSPASCLIAGIDSPLVEKLISFTKQKVITYGLKKGDWRLLDRTILSEGRGQILQIRNPDQSITEIQTSLHGEYNGLNVLAVWSLVCLLKLDQKKALSAFRSFLGVRRRFQVLGEFSGITLVEDFAHHPTAVRSVLQSAGEIYPGRRIIALFEPRSNTSRRNIFQKDYENALSLADCVFCMEAYDTSRISEQERFSSRQLVDNLHQKGHSAFYANSIKDMTLIIQKQVMEGDVIIIMSNGDFGGIYSLLQEAFSPHP
ncbi:MAG: Mur ligase family protein [Bdellovibrionales bacterium]|nr:Mur ligase family protein [Bdellovibrionales bacterium]